MRYHSRKILKDLPMVKPNDFIRSVSGGICWCFVVRCHVWYRVLMLSVHKVYREVSWCHPALCKHLDRLVFWGWN